jgi:hypothetical protein
VHDEITGQNLGYHEIIETILGMWVADRSAPA